jgi:predicted protein tyrosine phosphatase
VALPYALSVCGKQEVALFANAGVSHLLSLEDPGIAKETPPWLLGAHLQVRFHDVEAPDEAHLFVAQAPTREDVEEVLRFGEERLRDADRGPVHVLVHCFGGVARSPGAAIALAAQALGPGREDEAVDLIVKSRARAVPNGLVVKHADDLLDRGGALLRALVAFRRTRSRRDLGPLLRVWGLADPDSDEC